MERAGDITQEANVTHRSFEGGTLTSLGGPVRSHQQWLEPFEPPIDPPSDSDSDAKPGAEDERLKIDGETTNIGKILFEKDIPTHASPVEDSQSSCEAVGCRWPCNHHVHPGQDRGFVCESSALRADVEKGCSPCTMLRDVAETRCACLLTGERKGPRQHKDGRGYSVEVLFAGQTVSALIVECSCCAPLNLELTLPRESILPIPTIRGSIHEDRLSPDCLALFKSWIHRCDERHPLCIVSESFASPQRLIDVTDPHCRGEITLCSSLGRELKYLALSYCWGGKELPCTTTTNKLEYERGFSWNALPKSHLDTVLLARKLDVPYVWIDCYCIVQDDDHERDLEIARMGEIFRNAYIVVIDALAKSPFTGFVKGNPHPWAEDGRSGFKWHETLVRYRKLGLNKVKFRQKVHRKGEGKDACARFRIARRGWTYQERLLAPRCLIFQGREVIWECRTACYCECSNDQSTIDGDRYASQLLPLNRRLLNADKPVSLARRYFSNPDDAYRFWKSAVRSYSIRKLSKAADRLPAISALASIVQAATGDTYVAGLWKDDIVSQLLWYNHPHYEEMKPYDAYIAPSWSWAATPAPVHYDALPDRFESTCCVELVAVGTTCCGPNPCGPVSDGYLVLNGVHCSAEAVISVSSTTAWPNIKLILENRVIHASDNNRTEFTFLDGLRVDSVVMDIEPGRKSKTIQRQFVSTECEQTTCSGKVRLLWVEESGCLLLAYSQRVWGAFERIGILSDEMAPPMPTQSPSQITLV